MTRVGVLPLLACGVEMLALGEWQQSTWGSLGEETAFFSPAYLLLLGLAPSVSSGLNISLSEKCFCWLPGQGNLSQAVTTKN